MEVQTFAGANFANAAPYCTTSSGQVDHLPKKTRARRVLPSLNASHKGQDTFRGKSGELGGNMANDSTDTRQKLRFDVSFYAGTLNLRRRNGARWRRCDIYFQVPANLGKPRLAHDLSSPRHSTLGRPTLFTTLTTVYEGWLLQSHSQD